MTANELRIGNYFNPASNANGVILPATGVLLRVGGVNKFGHVEVIEPGNTKTWKYQAGGYFGVPLTPELLEKCGFVLKYGEYYTLNDLISFSFEKGIGLYSTWVMKDNNIPAVKYLHQLQNLYFALTGEELTVQP